VPTYDYRCRDCGHTIEIVHSILEDGPDACDRCRGPLVRVLHPAGVIFKGSGFYSTDSRKSPGSSDGSSAGSSAGAGEGSASGSAKPGSKPLDAGGSSTSSARGAGSADAD
jgi:putative FmdB family regulatory protein